MKTSKPKLTTLIITLLLHQTLQINFNGIRIRKGIKKVKNIQKEIYHIGVHNPDIEKTEQKGKKKTREEYLNPDNSPNWEKMLLVTECSFPNNFSNKKKILFNFFYYLENKLMKSDFKEMENINDNYFVYNHPNLRPKNLSCKTVMSENENFVIIDFLVIQKQSNFYNFDVFYLKTFIINNKLTFCKYLMFYKNGHDDFDSDKNCNIQNYDLNKDKNYPAFLDLQVYAVDYKENFRFQGYYNDLDNFQNFIPFIVFPKYRKYNFEIKINELNFISIHIIFQTFKNELTHKVSKSYLKINSLYENESLKVNIDKYSAFEKKNEKTQKRFKTECIFEVSEINKNNENLKIEEINEIKYYLQNSENTDINFLFISESPTASKISFNELEENFPGINTKKYKKFELNSFIVLQIFKNDEIQCKIKSNFQNFKKNLDENLQISVDIKIKKLKDENLLVFDLKKNDFKAEIKKKDFWNNENSILNCNILNQDIYNLINEEDILFFKIKKKGETNYGLNLKQFIETRKGIIKLKIFSEEDLSNCNISLKIENVDKKKKVIFFIELIGKKILDHFLKLTYKKNEKTFQILNNNTSTEFICKKSNDFENESFFEQEEIIFKTIFQNIKGYYDDSFFRNINKNEIFLNIGFSDKENKDEILEQILDMENNKGCYIYFFDHELVLNIFDNEEKNVRFKFGKVDKEKINVVGNIFKMEVFNNQQIIFVDENVELNENDDFNEKFSNKKIDLFFSGNENEDYLSFNLIKIDTDMFINNNIDGSFESKIENYNLKKSKLKNYFKDDNYFSNCILDNNLKTTKINFLKNYQNFDQEKYQLYFLQNIKGNTFSNYYLTKKIKERFVTKFLKNIKINNNESFIYINTPEIEENQLKNITEQPNEKFIIKILEEIPQKKNLKIIEPIIKFDQQNISDGFMNNFSINSIYKKNDNNSKRLFFICFYIEESKLKMILEDKTKNKQISAFYQNYNCGIYIIRQKKAFYGEDNLIFDINMVFEYTTGKEKKITIQRDLQYEPKCLFFTLEKFRLDSSLEIKGGVEVDKKNKSINVKFVQKKDNYLIV